MPPQTVHTLDLDDAAKARVRSMTGYGRIEREVALGGDIRAWGAVEARSVNHRYLDVRVKLPRDWTVLEPYVVEIVHALCERGKVDVALTLSNITGAPAHVHIDTDLAKAYVTGAQTLAHELRLTDSLALDDLLRLPNVIVQDELQSEYDLKLAWKSMKGLFEEALGHMWNMRAQEGTRLVADLSHRTAAIRDCVAAIETDLPGEVAAYQDRLKERIATLTGGDVPVEDTRLAQELAYYAERSDITEELVRLRAHLDAFDQLLDEGGTVGKKLDFLLQEMGREANTIGSKALSASTSHHAIHMKSEIEKLREQTQNIE